METLVERTALRQRHTVYYQLPPPLQPPRLGGHSQIARVPVLHPFENQLASNLRRHDWASVTTLLAVSGGADSVALLRAMAAIRKQLPGKFAALQVVHFHHGLRGTEADADAKFVQELAARCELKCVIGRATDDLAGQGDSVERAAREARYAFFTATANACGARYLLTAHTADDQAETILHRVLRGTGVAGLAGIPRVRSLSPLTTILRPLLDSTRDQVEAYLSELGQNYCQDASNDEVQFTRNRLRHELLPHLATNYNANVQTALRQLGQLAGEAQAVIDGLVTQLAEQAIVQRGDSQITLHLPALNAVAPYLLRELFIQIWQQQGWPLQPMTFEKWHELARLATLSHDEIGMFPGQIRAQKQGEQLMLTRPVD